ncbi:hypothetical protein BDV12DRAFT_184672 [Aspergillus spectabilis]
MGSHTETQTNPIPIPIKNRDLFNTRGLVAGSWKVPADGKSFPVYEHSCGEILRQCSDFGHQDFVDATDERGELEKWYELILENVDDLATILSLENGKIYSEATGEGKMAASYVSWFAEEATRSYGSTIPSSFKNTTVLTFREPVGVCGIITPWDFPAAMITRKIAPAFAAGCSVVIKAPSETLFSAIALAKLAVDAGIPREVVHVVPTKDRQARLELAVKPKVKKLSFTGSTGKVSMELGGNAPFIVFADADLDAAVEGAMVAKFRCAGQTCICANQIYVQRSIIDIFTAKLVARASKLTLGKGIERGTALGPLVNAAAVQKVSHQVHDAVSKGAVLKIGGTQPTGTSTSANGFFFEPTILINATKEMEVAHDEILEETVELANDTEFGLAGSFYSRDIGRVMRVARLECGMVGVNAGLMTACESPFGGVKESGVGIEGSKYGLGEYQNVKGVTIGGLDV